MLLLVDNYDSFTYNVADVLARCGADVDVVRNDALGVSEAIARAPEGIVLSPGPGGPEGAGICVELVTAAARARIPLLGICLGMQCIAHAFGARVERLDEVVHGSASRVEHDASGVLARMPQPFAAGRYHSLAVDESTLGPDLVATAHTECGILMGLRHRELPIEGVQFHPESVLTPAGATLLHTFRARTATHARPFGEVA